MRNKISWCIRVPIPRTQIAVYEEVFRSPAAFRLSSSFGGKCQGCMYIRCPEGLLCYSPQTSDTMAYFILDRGVFQILLAWSSCTLVRVCRKIAFPVPVELSSRRSTSLKTFETLTVTYHNLYYAILLRRTPLSFFFFFFLIPTVPAFRKLYRIHQTWN